MEKHEAGFTGYLIGAAVGLALVSLATCAKADQTYSCGDPDLPGDIRMACKVVKLQDENAALTKERDYWEGQARGIFKAWTEERALYRSAPAAAAAPSITVEAPALPTFCDTEALSNSYIGVPGFRTTCY